jgi:phage shock protein A
VKDPRIDVGDDALKAQFDLLLNIRDRLTDTNKAVSRVRSLHGQVEDWEKRTKDASSAGPIAAKGKEIRDELTAIETELVDTTAKKSPLMAPSRLSEKFNALSEFVGSADAAPAKQATEVFDELSQRLDEQLGRLEMLAGTKVKEFNDLIQQAALPPVG